MSRGPGLISSGQNSFVQDARQRLLVRGQDGFTQQTTQRPGNANQSLQPDVFDCREPASLSIPADSGFTLNVQQSQILPINCARRPEQFTFLVHFSFKIAPATYFVFPVAIGCLSGTVGGDCLRCSLRTQRLIPRCLDQIDC